MNTNLQRKAFDANERESTQIESLREWALCRIFVRIGVIRASPEFVFIRG